MVTEQAEGWPTFASGTGDKSVPEPQVEEEEEDGEDHPRESEDKLFHQSLGCGIQSIVKRVLSNNKVQKVTTQQRAIVYNFILRSVEWSWPFLKILYLPQGF